MSIGGRQARTLTQPLIITVDMSVMPQLPMPIRRNYSLRHLAAGTGRRYIFVVGLEASSLAVGRHEHKRVNM